MDVSCQRVTSYFSLHPVLPTQHLIEFALIKRSKLLIVSDKRSHHSIFSTSVTSLRPCELILPKKYRCKALEILSTGEMLIGTDRSEMLVAKDAEVIRSLKVHGRDAVGVTCIVSDM